MTTNTAANIKKVYAGIDALLDLRLGTLNVINTDFAVAVTTEKAYFVREEETFYAPDFGVLSKDIYKQVFNSKKDLIVRNSIKTKIYKHLSKILLAFQIQAISSPYQSGVELVVNTYPYLFTSEERIQLELAIKYNLGSNFNISIEYIPFIQLTPVEIKANYCALIMYDYVDWLNIHHKSIFNNLLNEVLLVIPKIYFNKKLNDEELSEWREHTSISIIDFFVESLQKLITIDLLPISLFCADTPLNLDEYD